MMAGVELKLFTIPEACEALRIGRNTMYKIIAKDEIKTVKIGRKRLVSQHELSRFIRERESS